MKKYLSSVLVLAMSGGLAYGGGRIEAVQTAQANPQPQPDCGCDPGIPSDVLATVNGAKITREMVDYEIKVRIAELRKQVAEARSRELENQLRKRVMDAEAAKRGVTIDQLEQQVVSTLKEPTEAEARAYYDQNKANIQGEFSEWKPSIISYLRDQRRQELINKFAAGLTESYQVRVLVATAAPPKNDAERARVLATVTGKPITAGDLEDALRSVIYDAQEEIYTLRRGQLDARINSLLLEQEAKKRNLSADSLYEAEIAPLIKPVRETDARTFYEQNRDRIQGGYVQVRQQIVEYLEGQEQTNAATAFAGKLRTTANLKDNLIEPEAPYYNISIDDRPWKGNPNAQVVIIEFTDFQCPSCGRTQPVLEQLMNEIGDKVKLVVRDFPLDQHAYAAKAAEAAEAARAQGKYWEYTALLFQNQNALEVVNLKEYATRLGLDRAAFDKALASGQYAAAVKKDLRDGTAAGVSSTPTVFVNGRKVKDKTLEGLKAAVQSALKVVGSRQ